MFSWGLLEHPQGAVAGLSAQNEHSKSWGPLNTRVERLVPISSHHTQFWKLDLIFLCSLWHFKKMKTPPVDGTPGQSILHYYIGMPGSRKCEKWFSELLCLWARVLISEALQNQNTLLLRWLIEHFLIETWNYMIFIVYLTLLFLVGRFSLCRLTQVDHWMVTDMGRAG